jgi:hypothetical protein
MSASESHIRKLFELDLSPGVSHASTEDDNATEEANALVLVTELVNVKLNCSDAMKKKRSEPSLQIKW